VQLKKVITPRVPTRGVFYSVRDQAISRRCPGISRRHALAPENRFRRGCVSNVAHRQTAIGVSSCQRYQSDRISTQQGRHALADLHGQAAFRFMTGNLKTLAASSHHSTDSLSSRRRSGIREPADCPAATPDRKTLAWVLKNGLRCLH
jgi:hypothetical protein